ncbi:MAG: hypothetical protein KDC80_25300 [Saprospiraceae bacterium]|nr:hypothetical protein [Saprospiraceae bacterium]
MTKPSKIVAWIFSVIAHPLLILTYGLILIIAFNPFLFGASSVGEEIPLILICFAYTFLLPLVSIIFMKLIGLVTSLSLPTKEERIGPMIICIVFYTWFTINIYRNSNIPLLLGIFAFGSVISLSLAFFVNIFSKISLHTVGWGGLMGLIVVMIWYFGYQTLSFFDWEIHIRLILVFLILIGGIISTSRLILGAHQLKDIYGGFLIGFTSQLIAIRILL